MIIHRLRIRCTGESCLMQVSHVSSDLMGRDLVTFDNYRTQDIYSLLWIAVDLKQAEVLFMHY